MFPSWAYLRLNIADSSQAMKVKGSKHRKSFQFWKTADQCSEADTAYDKETARRKQGPFRASVGEHMSYSSRSLLANDISGEWASLSRRSSGLHFPIE